VGLVRRNLSACLLGSVLCLLFGLWPLHTALDEVLDVEVRTAPRRTQTGRLLDESPVGQGFRCRWNGLRSIEVALTPLGPAAEAELELVLRADGPHGEVLRRARLGPAELAAGGAFTTFAFEPLDDSAGRELWFELDVPGERVQSPYSAWVRYHGQPGTDAPWGDRILPGTVFEGKLLDHSIAPGSRPTWGRVPHPHLAAVAFAFEAVRGGRARLEVFDEGADLAQDPPLRVALLDVQQSTRGGYAYFQFEPIADSRWKDLGFRLTVDQEARLVGFEYGPSLKTFHGGTPPAPPLLGMTRGGRVYQDRSLVFRARSSPSRAEAWALIRARAGWKLWAGGLCWVLAACLALRTIPRR